MSKPIEHALLALGIYHARTANVAGEVPIYDEIRQDCLIQGGLVKVNQRSRCMEGVDQSFGDDHVAKTE
jgi:hypothetical protein